MERLTIEIVAPDRLQLQEALQDTTAALQRGQGSTVLADGDVQIRITYSQEPVGAGFHDAPWGEY